MWSDSQAATLETPVRFAFTFMDLVDEDFLPMWMSKEATGGKDPDCEDAFQGKDLMAKLGTSLNRSSRQGKFFKKKDALADRVLKVVNDSHMCGTMELCGYDATH